MRIIGRFGDTRVPPSVLFDAGDPYATVPPGVVDLQFRVPVSLSLLLDAMAEAGHRAEVGAWVVEYSELVTRLLRRVQDAAGFALISADTAAPARLAVAATIEETIPGIGSRWHCHVWVGPTAPTLAEGEQCPVAVDILRQRAQSQVWAFYVRELEALSVREFGVRWAEPRPAAVREIVEPPWHEHIGSAERGVCRGPWGPGAHVVLADEQQLRIHAEMGRSHSNAVREGSAVRPAHDPAASRAALARSLMGMTGRAADSGDR